VWISDETDGAFFGGICTNGLRMLEGLVTALLRGAMELVLGIGSGLVGSNLIGSTSCTIKEAVLVRPACRTGLNDRSGLLGG